LNGLKNIKYRLKTGMLISIRIQIPLVFLKMIIVRISKNYILNTDDIDRIIFVIQTQI